MIKWACWAQNEHSGEWERWRGYCIYRDVYYEIESDQVVSRKKLFGVTVFAFSLAIEIIDGERVILDARNRERDIESFRAREKP